jgi:hypothetical protein
MDYACMTFLTRSRPACYTLGLPGSFWSFKTAYGTARGSDGCVTQVRGSLPPWIHVEFLHPLATARGSAI